MIRWEFNRRILLPMVALLLLGLVYLDRRDPGTPIQANSHDSTDLTEEKRRRLLRVVNAEKDINQSYGQTVLVYAEMVAAMPTFIEQPGQDHRQALEKVIREMLPSDGSVRLDSLTVAEPRQQETWGSRLTAEIKLRTFTHKAAMELLHALGRPAAGLVWERFALDVNEEKKYIDIDGRLAAVMVEAFE